MKNKKIMEEWIKGKLASAYILGLLASYISAYSINCVFKINKDLSTVILLFIFSVLILISVIEFFSKRVCKQFEKLGE